VSDWLLPLASIAAANLLGAMSPGPAFVLIVRTAIAHGRSAAWRPIAGLALGATVWTAAALWGLQALFAAAPWIAQMLPVAGGAFLIWFAARIWRGAASPVPAIGAPGGARTGFAHAFALQLANSRGTASWLPCSAATPRGRSMRAPRGGSTARWPRCCSRSAQSWRSMP
jgi:threonine/homoserine/homoserine lactone efflux protein